MESSVNDPRERLALLRALENSVEPNKLRPNSILLAKMETTLKAASRLTLAAVLPLVLLTHATPRAPRRRTQKTGSRAGPDDGEPPGPGDPAFPAWVRNRCEAAGLTLELDDDQITIVVDVLSRVVER